MHLKEMHKILSGESKCMLGIYLSGTGNTKYCVTKLVKLIDASADVVPLEDEFIIDKIKRNETVILGYPTQFSNAPYMVRDFIQMHASLWKGRKMICSRIETKVRRNRKNRVSSALGRGGRW